MAQEQDQRLAILNDAIVRLLGKLGDQELDSDARQRLEKELLALIDIRIEIEEEVNGISS